MSKQQGAGFWLLICLFGVLVAISAFGGWHFIMHLERQTTHYPEEPASTALQAPGTPQPRPLLPAPLVPLAGPEADSQDAAPASMLDLTLKGVITRSDPSRSRALIAIGKAAEQAYSQGEEIQDNVTLETIDSDHVVLRVNNRRETLYLNRSRPGVPDEQTVRQAGEPESAQRSTAAGLLGDFLHNRDPSLSRNRALAESIEGESEYLPTGQATDGVVSHDEAEPGSELEENRAKNEDEDWADDDSDETESMEQTGEVEEQ